MDYVFNSKYNYKIFKQSKNVKCMLCIVVFLYCIQAIKKENYYSQILYTSDIKQLNYNTYNYYTYLHIYVNVINVCCIIKMS